jgi:hypothetical protein
MRTITKATYTYDRSFKQTKNTLRRQQRAPAVSQPRSIWASASKRSRWCTGTRTAVFTRRTFSSLAFSGKMNQTRFGLEVCVGCHAQLTSDRPSYSTMQNRCRNQLAIGIKSWVWSTLRTSIYLGTWHAHIDSSESSNCCQLASEASGCRQASVKQRTSHWVAAIVHCSTFIHSDSTACRIFYLAITSTYSTSLRFARGIEFKDGRSSQLGFKQVYNH